MMSKSGIVRASSCFLAVGLWLATSDSFRPFPTAPPPARETVAEAAPDFAIPVNDQQEKSEKPVEVIDLTVKTLEAPTTTRTQTVNAATLTDGFRPGSVDPGAVAATEVARSQQWALADVYVESSEVTENGSVEYTIRASLRGDSARATASEVIAAARAVSPEVAVLADSLHFIAKSGDELDSLSSDAIRIRVRGGLTFEPSMLRWTFNAVPLRSSALEVPGRTEDAELVAVGPLIELDQQR